MSNLALTLPNKQQPIINNPPRSLSSSNGASSDRATTPVRHFPTTLRTPDPSRSSGRNKRWSFGLHNGSANGQSQASSRSASRAGESDRAPAGEEDTGGNDWNQLNDNHHSGGPGNIDSNSLPWALRWRLKNSKNQDVQSQPKSGNDSITPSVSSSRTSSLRKPVNNNEPVAHRHREEYGGFVAEPSLHPSRAQKATTLASLDRAKRDELSRMRPHHQNLLKQQENRRPTRSSSSSKQHLQGPSESASSNVRKGRQSFRPQAHAAKTGTTAQKRKSKPSNIQRAGTTPRPSSGQHPHPKLRQEPDASHSPADDLGDTLKIERRRPSSQASSSVGGPSNPLGIYPSGSRNENYFADRSVASFSQSTFSETSASSRDLFSHAHVDNSAQTTDADDDDDYDDGDDDDNATITLEAPRSTASLSLESDVSSSHRISLPSIAVESELDDDQSDEPERSRSESRSSSRPTRFAPVPVILEPVDKVQSPQHRSASPAKSALKNPLNRSSSRASTSGRGSPMPPVSSATEEPTVSTSTTSSSLDDGKRRVSFEADRASWTPTQASSSEAPERSPSETTFNRLKPVFFPKGREAKRKSWGGDAEYESIFKSRPSLPSFDSVRDRRSSMYDSAKSFGTDFQTPSRPTLGGVFENRRTKSSPGSAPTTPVDNGGVRGLDSGTFVPGGRERQSGNRTDSQLDGDVFSVPDSAALVPSVTVPTDSKNSHSVAEDTQPQSDVRRHSKEPIVSPEQAPADWDSLYGLGIRFPVGTRERDVAQTSAVSTAATDKELPSPPLDAQPVGDISNDADAATPEHEYFAFPEELTPGKVRFKRQDEEEIPALRPPKNRSASRSPGPVNNNASTSFSQPRQFTRRTDGDESHGLRQVVKKPSIPNINVDVDVDAESEPAPASSRPASAPKPQEQTPVNPRPRPRESKPELVTNAASSANPAPEVKKERKTSGFSLISWGISKTIGLFKRNSKNTLDRSDETGRGDPSLLDLTPVRGIPRRSTDAESTDLEDSSLDVEEDEADENTQAIERQKQSDKKSAKNPTSDSSDKRGQPSIVNGPTSEHIPGESSILHSQPIKKGQQTSVSDHSGTLKRNGGLLASLGFGFARQNRIPSPSPSPAPSVIHEEIAPKPQNSGSMALRKKPLPPVPSSSAPAVGPRSQSQQSVRRKGVWPHWCRDSTPEPGPVTRPATATPTKSLSKRGHLLSTIFRRRSAPKGVEPQEDQDDDDDHHLNIPDLPPTLHIKFDHSFGNGEDMIPRDYSSSPTKDDDSPSTKRRSLTLFNLQSTSNLHTSSTDDQTSLQDKEPERPSSVQRHKDVNHNNNSKPDDTDESLNQSPFPMPTLFDGDNDDDGAPVDRKTSPAPAGLGLGIAFNTSSQDFHRYQVPLSPIAESPSSPKSSLQGSRRNSDPSSNPSMLVNAGLDKQSISHEARESRRPSPASVSNSIDGSLLPTASVKASTDATKTPRVDNGMQLRDFFSMVFLYD